MQISEGNQRRYVDGVSGAYNTEKFNASGGLGLREDDRQRIIASSVIAPAAGGAQAELSRERLDEHVRRLIPSANGAIDFHIDETRTLGADFKIRQRSGDRYYDRQDDGSLQDGSQAVASYGHSDGHKWSLSGEERLRFKQTLGSADETLELSLHRTTDKERERYTLLTKETLPAVGLSGDQLYLNHDFASNDFSLDYRTPLATGGVLKLGYGIRRDDYGFDNAGNDLDPASGAVTPNANLTNQFYTRQTIQALYGSYEKPLEKWLLLAGVRAEQTTADGNQLTSNIINHRRYAGTYPTVNLERPFDEKSTLSFGYSRRLSRPDPDDLNPFVDHQDSHNLRAGDANLLPQESQSLEAGYRVETDKLNYGLTGYLRRFRNSFTDVTTVVSPDVLLTTKANLPSSSASGLEFNANGSLNSTLSYRVSGNLFHSQIDATALGATGLASTTGLNLKASLDYRPTALDMAQLSLSRADRRLTTQGYVDPINLVNLGYKRQLQPNFSVVMTVSDVFNGQRFRRHLDTPGLTQTYERDQAGRIAYIGVVYLFGTVKKTRAAGFDYDQ